MLVFSSSTSRARLGPGLAAWVGCGLTASCIGDGRVLREGVTRGCYARTYERFLRGGYYEGDTGDASNGLNLTARVFRSRFVLATVDCLEYGAYKPAVIANKRQDAFR